MDRFKNIEKFFFLTTIIVSCLFITLLTVIKLPDWWSYIILESSPMTWFESVLLFACAVFAWLNAMFTYLQNEKKPFVLWGLLGIFFIGLSLDERFAIHERIRTLFLAPQDIKNPLFFWTDTGDFVLITVLLIALLFLPVYLKIFKERKSSLILFLVGLGFSVLAIVMDSIHVKGYSMEFQRLEQYVEEVLETFAMLFFLNSLFLMFTHLVKQYAIIKKKTLS
ncbi:MAG TPA: hypothetical protein DDZ89_13085 [Clostridiales bacterium]|nr:hypothetical protein [Clostridiales bacterium]